MATPHRSTSSELPTLKPLSLLKKRYRITRHLGKGGFGTVYLAEDTLLDISVAVKTVGKQEEEILQIRQEAHLLAVLKHPGIPTLVDLFEERGRWYLVMEYVEGSRIAPGSMPMPLSQVLWIGLQLCDIVAYLSRFLPPLIHRDIKPGNVFLNQMKELYLLDFGIACFPGPNTRPAGSSRYSAPEQMKRETMTPKVDIYGTGAFLADLLLGKPSAATEESVTHPRKKPPVSTSAKLLALSSEQDELQTLLSRMTLHAPDLRPDIETVIQTLLKLAGSIPVAPPALC